MTTGARAAERHLAAPPGALLEAVDERCRALAATAAGRVFRVPCEGAEAALLAEGRTGARYDTILSFMCTPQVPSLTDYVAAIEQVLASGGWICMVEPAGLDRGPVRGWLTARLRRQSPQRRDTGRDVVSAVRSGGFVVTDIHRREAPSVPAAWRQYVVLKARRHTPEILSESPAESSGS